MTIDAGLLRHKITLSVRSTSTNGYGEVTSTYTDQDSVHARVIFNKGREAFDAAHENATETIRVQMRYRDVATDDVIKWNNRQYQVTSVDDSLRHNNEMWVTAKAVDR